ncbi:MAG: ImmA/IrrE family metallo-endopeptidase [Bacteroidetes bacterium]|nr:ImmA/IrrE family metallo-endopeptidase [Bacteroidota bacterium]
MYNEIIEEKTTEILRSCKINSLPIAIDEIALARGLKLKPYDMGEEISGVLVIEGDTSTIGYNTRHPEVRQRFTIAHELGHYELHKSKNELFVDKNIPVILYRDQNSHTGEDKLEQQANSFAAAILMPVSFLKKEIKAKKIKSLDDSMIVELAKTFNVSVAAMSIRISNVITELQ